MKRASGADPLGKPRRGSPARSSEGRKPRRRSWQEQNDNHELHGSFLPALSPSEHEGIVTPVLRVTMFAPALFRAGHPHCLFRNRRGSNDCQLVQRTCKVQLIQSSREHSHSGRSVISVRQAHAMLVVGGGSEQRPPMHFSHLLLDDYSPFANSVSLRASTALMSSQR